jgi:hypothetical protein
MNMLQIDITSDELRRAYTIALLSAMQSSGQDADEEEASLFFDALARQFPMEKVAALLSRVAMLMVWIEFGDSDGLIRDGEPPLNLPEIHPAVLDVIATTPLPKDGLPKPGRLHREIEKRLLSYDILEGW